MSIYIPQPKGYIAIVSASIISTLLLAYVFTESLVVFWNRADQLDQESAAQSIMFVESCAYTALQQFAESGNVAQTPEQLLLPIDVDSAPVYCTVNSETLVNNIVTISVTAKYRSSVSTYQVQAKNSITSGITSITTWRDITSIPP